MGKYLEKLPLWNQPIQLVPTVMSRGDQSTRSFWALATTSPAKRNSSVICVYMRVCVCVWGSICAVLLQSDCAARNVFFVFRSCVGAAVSHRLPCLFWSTVYIGVSDWASFIPWLTDELMTSWIHYYDLLQMQTHAEPNTQTHTQVCACIKSIEWKICPSWVRQKLIVEQLMYR